MNPAKEKTKPRLMIVDDEPDVTIVLTEYLEDDFEVESFNDPLGAWAYLQDAHFDLMITDIRMPGMDGYELLAKARNLYPDLPVLQCTGHAITDEEKQRGLECGAAGVLSKPFGGPGNVLEFIVEKVPSLADRVTLIKDQTPKSFALNFTNTEPQTTSAAAPSHLPRALIVDDDEDVAFTLMAMIESHYACTIATEGQKALDLLDKEEFGILITDLNMPGMSGLKIIRSALGTNPGLRIFISTGLCRSDPVVVEAFEAGAIGAMIKPFMDPEQLIQILSEKKSA